MPKVIADITMSLDGYVTGPGADEQHGLGDAPELHTCVTEQDAVDKAQAPRVGVPPNAGLAPSSNDPTSPSAACRVDRAVDAQSHTSTGER